MACLAAFHAVAKKVSYNLSKLHASKGLNAAIVLLLVLRPFVDTLTIWWTQEGSYHSYVL